MDLYARYGAHGGKIKVKFIASDSLHPASVFVYIISLLALSMMFFDPAFIVLSLFIAIFQGVIFTSAKKVLKGLLWGLPAIAIIAAVNAIVSRGGETVLFYLFGSPVSSESIFYGLCSGVMLVAIIIYFTVYNRLLPPERFLYLFSGILPAFSMVVTMTQRFIPALIKRFQDIRNAQQSFKKAENGKGIKKYQPLFREISTLLSWSMEEGLETADSMKAKGYGCAKRSSYSVYRFTAKDTFLIAVTVILTAIAITFYYLGGKIEFYPEIVYRVDFTKCISILAVSTLGLILPIVETVNGIKWRLREKC